jgi:hypothetical protein
MTEAKTRIPRPAPAARARWSAEEAIAYLVKGVPLPWKEWQRAGATASEIEQAEIDLGQVISEGVPAWGWHPLEKRRKQIPSDDFRDEKIENKAVPVSVAHQPKVVVRIDGNVGTSPPSRIAHYLGPLWSKIEVDAAALRQAGPLTTPAEPAIADSEPAAMVPKDWLPAARRNHPRLRNELLVDYAGRLRVLMQKANVTKVWPLKTLLRRLHDK